MFIVDDGGQIDWTDPLNRDEQLNRGLVSWWMVGEDNPYWGGAKLFDIAGKNHGAVTNGPVFSAFKPPGAFGSLKTDGVNDYVDLPETITGYGGTTKWWFSLWYYANAGLTGNESPFGDSLATFGLPTIRWNTSGPQWTLFAGDGSSFFCNVNLTGVAALTWQCLTVTYDGTTTLRYWINGVKATAAVTGGATLAASAADLRIGGGATASAAAWPGYVADVRVGGRSLSDVEGPAIYHDALSGYQRTLNRVQRNWFTDTAVAAVPTLPHFRSADPPRLRFAPVPY